MKRILDSQGRAFDKDATKPALKTGWFLVYPLFGFIFCVEYLFHLQVVSMLLSGCPWYRKKYIYIFFFACESRSSKQKGVFHFRLLILLCSHSKRQHVDSFCAEPFFDYCALSHRARSFGPINGLFLSASGVIDSGFAALVEHKALFISPGCPRCFADLNRFA